MSSVTLLKSSRTSHVLELSLLARASQRTVVNKAVSTMSSISAEQQTSIHAWLRQLPLGELTRQAAAAAFESVGIEELSDFSAVDEDVYEEIEAELQSWGLMSCDAQDLFQALARHAVFERLNADDNKENQHMLPYKSPTAAYFDGHNSFMPESPDSVSCCSSTASESLCSVSNSSLDTQHECRDAHSSYVTSVVCCSPCVLVSVLPMYMHPTDILSQSRNLDGATYKASVEVTAGARQQGAIAGNVWNLAQEPQGSRDVQRALEEADSNNEREALACEMHGHVCEAMQCLHANHVLQKCVSTLEPSAVQFVIDELAEQGPRAICDLASHRFGCRVLEKILMRCESEQLSKVVTSLIADAAKLCMHRYGNFVMQRLLERKEWLEASTGALKAHLWEIGQNFFGSHVLSHALRQEPLLGQHQLSKAILADQKLIAELNRSRHGAAVVALAFENTGKSH